MVKQVLKNEVLFVCVILILFSCGQKNTSAVKAVQNTQKPLLSWYVPDAPPASIRSGVNTGKGYVDNLINFIIERLPEYRHEVVTSNVKRFTEDAKAGVTAVYPSMLKSAEREAFLYFSKPVGITVPHSLIIRKNDYELFRPYMREGKIALKRLLSGSELKLAFSIDASAGPYADPVIKNPDYSSKIIFRTGVNIYEGLIRMLEEGHADYVIGYSHVFYPLILNANYSNEFSFYQIEENRDELFYTAHIALAKNPEGEKVLARINEILEKTDVIEQTRDRMLGFIDEKTAALYYVHIKTMLKNYYGR
jgi:uncharacterized protein (TIGR02285 family)